MFVQVAKIRWVVEWVIAAVIWQAVTYPLSCHGQHYQVPQDPMTPTPRFQEFIARPGVLNTGLMEDGVNGVNQSKGGKTPLMLAIEDGDVESVLYLLEQGADRSVKDAQGETAMDIAKRGPNRRIEQILETDLALRPAAADYYAGKSARIRILDGQNQTGTPNGPAPKALTILVSDAKGRPLQNAPVRLEVTGSTGALMPTDNSPYSKSLVMRTDDRGVCSVYFILPDLPSYRSSVVASVGILGNMRKVVFVENTDDGTHGYSHWPWDITDCIGQMTNDGGEIATWQKHTEHEQCMKIVMIYPDGSSRTLATLPPGTTTGTVPGNAWR